MSKILPLLISLFVLTHLSCDRLQQREEFIIDIKNPDEEKTISFKLKKTYSFQAMRILEKSLDDTCLIGVMKISPGSKGNIYKIEFFADSLTYKYLPYKASKGTLQIEHSFFD